MTRGRASAWRAWLRAAALFGLLGAAGAQAQDAPALKARHAALRGQLAGNPFGRPLVLESRQGEADLQGDIYAQIEQPFGVAGPALQDIANWCDILILHLNVKRCRTSASAGAKLLSLNIGGKLASAAIEAYRVEFTHKVAVSRPDYLQVTLDAPNGPMGTHDYRIVLEVVALDAGRSFLHLSYTYAYGFAARVGMQGYLATVGRSKVGFSVVGTLPDGQPAYIGGMRGVVERNTMRYFLAVESYLGALSLPAPQQLDKRLSDWFSGVERYPRQLHELERAEYLAMKHQAIIEQAAAGD